MENLLSEDNILLEKRKHFPFWRCKQGRRREHILSLKLSLYSYQGISYFKPRRLDILSVRIYIFMCSVLRLQDFHNPPILFSWQPNRGQVPYNCWAVLGFLSISLTTEKTSGISFSAVVPATKQRVN